MAVRAASLCQVQAQTTLIHSKNMLTIISLGIGVFMCPLKKNYIIYNSTIIGVAQGGENSKKKTKKNTSLASFYLVRIKFPPNYTRKTNILC